MKILIAPDSFKGSLSAKEAADSIEKGIKKADKEIQTVKVPMADGGEGTVESLVDVTGGKIHKVYVYDPLMREIESFYGILGDGETAVIEMAAASGLTLLPRDERNPLLANTYGTGQLILAALNMGCKKMIIGLGGSATNDGGAGMAAALGVRFFDSKREIIMPNGGNLKHICDIDIRGLDTRVKDASIEVAYDVENPLIGPNGASYIFGPQKGADIQMVEELDKGLQNYGLVLEKLFNRSLVGLPGAGAAGGFGAGLVGFLDAKLIKGIDIVMGITKLEEKMNGVDLVITGEGMMDYQTAFGKTPYGVAKLANKYKIPVIALTGAIGAGAEILYEKGFNSIFSIIDKPMTLEEAIHNSKILLENAAERIIRAVKINDQ